MMEIKDVTETKQEQPPPLLSVVQGLRRMGLHDLRSKKIKERNYI
jgi:hypothetical protein